MKNAVLSVLVIVLALTGLMMERPAAALEGTATISTKDLYSLAQRKTYRLGLRGSVQSPSDNINNLKDPAYEFGLEFDAKLNENLDCGPRFGIVSKKLNNGSTVNASYTALKFGFGGRIYTMYWGERESTHGFFNLYLALEGDYYAASKSSDITTGGALTNPATFAGVGGYGGVGLEIAFGPNTGGFVEAGYQKTSINSAAGDQFPLDGFLLALGARLAFF